VPPTDKKQIETSRRERLRASKPLVYDKVIQLDQKFARGECVAMVDITFDYACNLSCSHCSNASFAKKDRALTVADLRDFAAQADALGLCLLNISGGEPLVFEELDEIIRALDPPRFYLSMSTNGYLLDAERARHLKAVGLDKIKVSLDSINEHLHNANRRKEGAYRKAHDALFAARQAGLDVIIQHVVTHQNTRTPETEELARFATEHGFMLDIVIIKALGRVEGRHDVLITEEDAAHLRELHQRYPVLRRDVFPSYGIDRGCGAVNSTFQLTKYGDILPCGYIHISIGNIFEEPLAAILDRGLSIKHFRDYNPRCLAGEDRCFIETYMTKFYGKPLPIHWTEAFTDEDFIR
jgi:MoaA/NifB/PqqE/SkfB family radical SAM enzyme